MLIVLAVRRFRCPDRSCPKVTFAEQVQGLTVRYRRRSVPLLGMLAVFGLELGGWAAARLAGALGVPVHSSTLLRLVMALPDPLAAAAPQVTRDVCGRERGPWCPPPASAAPPCTSCCKPGTPHGRPPASWG